MHISELCNSSVCHTSLLLLSIVLFIYPYLLLSRMVVDFEVVDKVLKNSKTLIEEKVVNVRHYQML